jgi:hypothetical protein
MKSNKSILKVTILSLLLFCIINTPFSQINYQLYKDFPLGAVGGGPGYQGMVQYDASFTTVSSLIELRAALSNPSIKKIFIKGNLSFQVVEPLVITTDDLILASDRGQFNSSGRVSRGAMLQLSNGSTLDNNLLISVQANNVRITGLRLSAKLVEEKSVGILLNAKLDEPYMHLEVDNCELYLWGNAAVSINGTREPSDLITHADVHHNHIHHNNRKSLGYGTVINYYNAESQLCYNFYDDNRHSVAGYGRPGEKYTAAYNLTLKNKMQAEYDMHGYSDIFKRNCDSLKICHPYAPCNYGGTEIILLNNAVLNARFLIVQRGIPQKGLYVTNNFYKAPNKYRLWKEWDTSINAGSCNLPYPNNKTIELNKSQWKKYNMYVWANNKNPQGRHVQYISWSGKNKWQPLFFNAYKKGELKVGDFNGDKVSDFFYADGAKWQISRNGVTPWEKINTSGTQTSQLALGDFNGDNETDVFIATGGQWKVSWSGRSKWEKINTSNTQIYQLAFGDFNGDGQTDVFIATGGQWKVSWSGRSKWEKINTSNTQTNQLAFGDFNGDGQTDVFISTGGQWKVSWSGTSKWEKINSSGYKTNQLAFGDFNGDGKTDVFIATGSEWRVSWSGKSKWETINSSGHKTNELIFGDFNGDGITDIVREASF